MRWVTRVSASTAVAFLLVPMLCAHDAAKPAARTKKSDGVNSRGGLGVLAEAKPTATPAPLPAATPSQSTSTDREIPKVELFVGYSFLRNVPTDAGNRLAWLHGASTSVAINLSRHLGLVADFGGSHADRFGPFAPPNGGVVDASGNVFTYLFGPRLSFRHDRVTPFVQVLFGGVHASNVNLSGCSGIGCSPLSSENAFAMTAGGGLDVTLHRHIALRLVQAEYFMTRFMDRSSVTGNTATQNDVRLSTGIVFRFGGNHPAPPPTSRLSGPPVASCSVDKSMVYAGSGETIAARAEASDPGNNPLTYTWTTSDGAVEGSGSVVRWNSAGMAVGPHTFRVRVDNGRGGTADCSAVARVEPQLNRPPTVSCSADRSSVSAGEPVQINATASDPDNDPLTYSWDTTGGRIIGSGSSVRLDTSGLAPNQYTVTGRVNDGRGETADCSVSVNAQRSVVEKQLEATLALRSIYFQTGRPTKMHSDSGLVESQQEVLTSLASDFERYLTFKPDAHLILGGHADLRGSSEFNKTLTERRVERAKSFLVAQGVPSSSIEVQSFGKEENLNAEQVKQQMQENPDLSPDDRQKMLNNLQVIVLANNRRVDVSLSTTGQQSVRRYPFNAKDSLALISTKGSEEKSAAKQQ